LKVRVCPDRALPERRRRIAAEVHRHLVDYLEEEPLCTAAFVMFCTDLAGQEPIYRAPMARISASSRTRAQGHTPRLAGCRARDASAPGSLAHAGRPTRPQDWARNLSTRCCTPRYSTMAPLHSLEPIVILKYPAPLRALRCCSRIFWRASSHGTLHEPVNVVRTTVASLTWGHHLGAYSARRSPCRVPPSGMRRERFLLKLGDLVGHLVHLAEFLLNPSSAHSG